MQRDERTSALIEWEKVEQVAGNLLKPRDDLFPVRYEVTEYPTDEQFEQMGAVFDAN